MRPDCRALEHRERRQPVDNHPRRPPGEDDAALDQRRPVVGHVLERMEEDRSEASSLRLPDPLRVPPLARAQIAEYGEAAVSANSMGDPVQAQS